MNRRTALLSAASALALAACGTITPAQAKTDVDLVADVVKVEVPIIRPSLPLAVQAQVTGYADQIEAARQAIDKTLASGGTVNAQTFVAALQALAPLIAANAPPNSPAAIAIASALALAPLILAQFGSITARQAPTISPADAERHRMVLRGALAR